MAVEAEFEGFVPGNNGYGRAERTLQTEGTGGARARNRRPQWFGKTSRGQAAVPVLQESRVALEHRCGLE